MAHIWDFDPEELKKTEQGRILLLERSINDGPNKDEKIKLAEVKRYWNKLSLFPLQKRLLELLIWGKYQSSLTSRKSFWMK